MKKMIPVYILQTAMLAALITFGFLLLRKAEAIKVEIGKSATSQYEGFGLRLRLYELRS